MSTENKQTEQTEEALKNEFSIQRMYLKNLSLETPGAPDVFKTQWRPEMKLNIQNHSELVEENIHEVTLHVTATVVFEEKTIFIIDVLYAGIFTIKNFTPEQMDLVLNSVCPSMLYPYAREVVSDVANRGSFPQLLLAPINFDALYAEKQRREQEQSAQKN